jgi:hypothetical protein
MFLNKLGSVLKSGGGALNWKYISNLVTSEFRHKKNPNLILKGWGFNINDKITLIYYQFELLNLQFFYNQNFGRVQYYYF